MAVNEIAGDPLARGDSLRDRALAVLRQAIVSGRIRGGEMYSAAALARRLGVSVSPVREAMLTLVNEGILEPVRNRGFRVVPLDEHDLQEIYRLRVLLEVPTVRDLATARIGDRLAALAGSANAIESAARDGDVQRFLQADRDFHLTLLGLSGNRRLVDLVATLRDQTRLYGVPTLADRGLLAASAEEHRQILDALAAADADAAERLMRVHLSHIVREWSTGEL